MTKIKIPRTAKGVDERLGDLGRMAKATEWERACLVATRVRLPGKPGPTAASDTRFAAYLTCKQFSDLGVVGLRNEETVRIYVRIWLEANDGQYPELGATLNLPDIDWPPTSLEASRYQLDDKDAITAAAGELGTGATKALDIAKNRKAMAAAIKGSPIVAAAALDALTPEAIVEAVASRPELARAFGGTDAASAVIEADWQHAEGVSREISRRGGGGRMNDALNAFQKTLLQLGAISFEGAAKKMYDAIERRATSGLIWRPGEKEAVIEQIDAGLQLALNTKALLTPVSDEDLANLLAGQEGE